jgi:hypothetical protein
LEKRAEQVLPGSEGNGREEEGVGEKNEKIFLILVASNYCMVIVMVNLNCQLD